MEKTRREVDEAKSAGRLDEGFVELVNSHRRMLERVCRIYEEGAEERRDLFQDVVYQLWRSWPGFRGEAKVSTWVYRVALNTAITALRREKARPERGEADAELGAHGAEVGTPGEGRVEELNAAIRELNKVERAVVAMYLEGFAYREIGEALGLTETNVGVKLNRIKGKLQGLLRGSQ